MSTFKIELRPLNSEEGLNPVFLPDGVEVVLGRTPEFKIRDPRCSRKQLILVADYKKNSVSIKRTGGAPSLLGGLILERGSAQIGVDETVLEVLPNALRYKIVCLQNLNELLIQKGKKREKSPLKEEKNSKRMRLSYKWDKFSPKGLRNIPSARKTLLRCVTHSESIPDSDGLAMIAAFDMDGTLIKTKSGYVFPKNSDDWTIWDGKVLDKLKSLHSQNYQLVVFTNQASLRMENKIPDFKIKIENILSEINLPIRVYISTTYDEFRKPAPGMWMKLVEDLDGKIDIENSFYVGDAAGREKNWAPKKNKDHSLADRLFARNINLAFFTPEEYFLDSVPARYLEPPFDPKNISVADFTFVPSTSQEAIVMVGSPASGKSNFVKHHLVTNNYKVINMDTLKSWLKCVKEMKRLLEANYSIVVDNTNPKAERRIEIIEMCKAYKVPVRCFSMSTTLNHCLHNNKYREMNISDDTHAIVEPSVIMSYWKAFEEPSLEEGFSEILKIGFIPKFESEEAKKMYFMHLIDAKLK